MQTLTLKLKKKAEQEYTFEGRARIVQVGQPFFGPHKNLPRYAVVTRPHDSPSGIPLRRGYKIDLGDKERRDRWLRSQGFRGKL